MARLELSKLVRETRKGFPVLAGALCLLAGAAGLVITIERPVELSAFRPAERSRSAVSFSAPLETPGPFILQTALFPASAEQPVEAAPQLVTAVIGPAAPSANVSPPARGATAEAPGESVPSVAPAPSVEAAASEPTVAPLPELPAPSAVQVGGGSAPPASSPVVAIVTAVSIVVQPPPTATPKPPTPAPAKPTATPTRTATPKRTATPWPTKTPYSRTRTPTWN